MTVRSYWTKPNTKCVFFVFTEGAQTPRFLKYKRTDEIWLTAAIRYELGDRHTFEFVEGGIPVEPDPSIKSMLSGDEKTWSYFVDNDPITGLKAFGDLEGFFETRGPYDGVICYSQASSLVGTWILHRRRQQKSCFHCAIFLSAGSPAVDLPSLSEGNIVPLSDATVGQIIDIPTAHIWGKSDPLADIAEGFSMLYDSSVRSIFIHDGGHEVPGSSSDTVTQTVNTIRRAIALAQMRL